MASSSLVSVDEPVHSSSSSSSSVRLLSQTPYWLLGGVDVDFGSIHPLRPGLVLPSMSDSAALGNVANRSMHFPSSRIWWFLFLVTRNTVMLGISLILYNMCFLGDSPIFNVRCHRGKHLSYLMYLNLMTRQRAGCVDPGRRMAMLEFL